MKNFVTVPGLATPVVASAVTAQRKVLSPSIAQVPVGESVSKIYPWLSGLKQTISGVAGAETRIVRAGYGSSAFVNTTDRHINIKEIRFFTYAPVGTTFPAFMFNTLQIATHMGVKIRHTDFEIISDWTPSGMLATQNDNIAASSVRCNLCFTLPTQYYLQAGHPFRLRLRLTNPYNAVSDYVFWVVLFGKDPRTNKIYELCKQVTIPYRAVPAVSDANPQYVDVVFDENRDYPMRDLLLTNMGFVGTPFSNANRMYVLQYFSQIDFQIIPPEGPKWMDFADWVPTANLVDQGTSMAQHNLVIYAPKTVIPFSPSQQIDIDVRANTGMYYNHGERDVYEVPLWVSLIGTQEQRPGL